ncbi:MAG: TRAM domain-containing protein [Candidatus Micrarchaeota archaeon]
MEENSKFGIPKPVSEGDKIVVKIESQGGQGDGIAKIDGFVIFVKGATKGEQCNVRIISVKRTFATAEKLSSIK